MRARLGVLVNVGALEHARCGLAGRRKHRGVLGEFGRRLLGLGLLARLGVLGNLGSLENALAFLNEKGI